MKGVNILRCGFAALVLVCIAAQQGPALTLVVLMWGGLELMP